MLLRRLHAAAVVLAATVLLTGCFVASKNLPDGRGPVADQRLVGAWEGIDDGDHNPTTDAVVLTFQMTSPTRPLQLTWSEDNKRLTYDVYTRQYGAHMGFAARLTGPAEAQKEDETNGGYFLGYYEFTPSGEGLMFYLLDKKKVAPLIASGKLNGDPGKSEYAMSILNGSSSDIGRFLASPEAYAARSEDPAKLRRLPPSK
jgi:hypothetical protein